MKLTVPLVLAAVAFGGPIAACSADGDSGLVEDPGGATTPEPTSSLPPTGGVDSGPPVDAGKDASKDSGKDANDAGKDAGPPPPNPGDPCAKDQEVFTKACGKCGKQQALCLDGKVTEYGPCENETGVCVAGEQQACGNCGKQTCTSYCAWTACTGEPPSACTPTSHDYSTAGCPTPKTYHQRECGNDCKWSAYSVACTDLAYRVVASGAAGGTASGIFPLRSNVVDTRMSGTCASASFSTTTNHAYAYVEVVNPTNQQITASAWNTVATEGGVIVDTNMAWYPSNVKPANEAERKTCSKGIATSCPSNTPCGDYRWAGMSGSDALVIPPFGSVLVWFGSYYPIGGGVGTTADQGDVKLVIRTDSLQ